MVNSLMFVPKLFQILIVDDKYEFWNKASSVETAKHSRAPELTHWFLVRFVLLYL